jgi:hypothetical protein
MMPTTRCGSRHCRTFRLTLAVVSLAVGSGCGPPRAATQPARYPTTHPTTRSRDVTGKAAAAWRVKVDLSTPAAAYETVAKAMRDGDARAFRLCMLVPENLVERKQVEAFAQLIEASGRLRRAATERFGPETAAKMLECPVHVQDPGGWGEMLLDQVRAVGPEGAQIDGDEAKMSGCDFASGELERVGGQWRIRFAPKLQVHEPDRFVAILWTRGAQFRQYYARQIEAGRFRRAAEALDEINRVGTSSHLPEEILREHLEEGTE